MQNEDLPRDLLDFVKNVFGDEGFEIEDFDTKRVYIKRNNEEFTIRIWSLTDKKVEWTLFKSMYNNDGSGFGEKKKDGVYKFS
ncbi:hypothetical protein J2S74_002905 [Evansella vedderi]|uniref:Uncharacterized protein n=1 Tax=Evansella vedderi TaxID=38282 RepID=A0ABT9ZWC0_9BACI|nr:hypothetical protein [Evansella vedderi]MDQ0255523.1 hypothetical protein [Evansella vedderi]